MRLLVASVGLALILAAPVHAENRAATPVVEEALKTPRIAAALAARERMDNAAIAQDLAAIRAGLAPEMILNGPNNRVNDGAAIVANIGAGQLTHTTLVRSIEYAAQRGSDVIFMGEEAASAPGPDGTTVVRRRRFTDIWTETADGWKIVLRQATIYRTD
jgi:ketosteroid isomerase-like protein